jgi:3-dehydroquinate synthase
VIINNEIEITSKIKNYTIVIVETISDLIESIKNVNTYYIIDREVGNLYPDLVTHIDKNRILYLISNEGLKTLSGSEMIFDFFIKNNINKKSKIIAIGGGVIQDVVTFATHVFHRGIEWVYVPTTLLAMSDSCIGAKSAINYKGIKNPLGVFHPPKKILLYFNFVNTLKYSDLLSGYGEILKLNIIGGKNSNILINNNHKGIECRKSNSLHILKKLIKDSLLIKKKFIEKDEFDVGDRRILNYGHTFGHALESALNNKIPHGIAVVIGIDIVNYISYRLGHLSKESFENYRNYYDKLYRNSFLRPFDFKYFLDRIRNDKKTTNGKVLLSLPKSSGIFFLKHVSIEGDLQLFFLDYIDEDNIFKIKLN